LNPKNFVDKFEFDSNSFGSNCYGKLIPDLRKKTYKLTIGFTNEDESNLFWKNYEKATKINFNNVSFSILFISKSLLPLNLRSLKKPTKLVNPSNTEMNSLHSLFINVRHLLEKLKIREEEEKTEQNENLVEDEEDLEKVKKMSSQQIKNKIFHKRQLIYNLIESFPEKLKKEKIVEISNLTNPIFNVNENSSGEVEKLNKLKCDVKFDNEIDCPQEYLTVLENCTLNGKIIRVTLEILKLYNSMSIKSIIDFESIFRFVIEESMKKLLLELDEKELNVIKIGENTYKIGKLKDTIFKNIYFAGSNKNNVYFQILISFLDSKKINHFFTSAYLFNEKYSTTYEYLPLE